MSDRAAEDVTYLLALAARLEHRNESVCARTLWTEVDRPY